MNRIDNLIKIKEQIEQDYKLGKLKNKEYNLRLSRCIIQIRRESENIRSELSTKVYSTDNKINNSLFFPTQKVVNGKQMWQQYYDGFLVENYYTLIQLQTSMGAKLVKDTTKFNSLVE